MRSGKGPSGEPPLGGRDPGALVLLAIAVVILAVFLAVTAPLPR